MNGIPMRFDYSETINEQLDTFNYYKQRYASYELEIQACWNKINDLQQRIDKAIEYIEENKNKAYAPYGDNEDYDYEVCLDEDEIKYLLKLLKGDNND